MRKKKIKILHVAQAAGGVDRYIRMLLKYLDKSFLTGWTSKHMKAENTEQLNGAAWAYLKMHMSLVWLDVLAPRKHQMCL